MQEILKPGVGPERIEDRTHEDEALASDRGPVSPRCAARGVAASSQRLPRRDYEKFVRNLTPRRLMGVNPQRGNKLGP